MDLRREQKRSLIGGFHANMWRNFNKMQMILSALSGSSNQVPVTPVGGNWMYYTSWEQHAFMVLAKQTVAPSIKHLSYIVYGTLEYRS